jgi:hypothetical protein
MDIISINQFIRFNSDLELFDLFNPTLLYLDDVPGIDVSFKTFLVEEHHEMRIDLLFRDMYELESNEVGIYLGNIDVLCFINDIDNPLNIVKGMSLRYPGLEDFDKFRTSSDSDEFSKKEDVKSKLVVPNKSTRKDKSREKFKEAGYSLPPVVLDKPRPPVRIKNGKFSVGGL